MRIRKYFQIYINDNKLNNSVRGSPKLWNWSIKILPLTNLVYIKSSSGHTISFLDIQEVLEVLGLLAEISYLHFLFFSSTVEVLTALFVN